MLDCQLYGLKPAGHHFTNVLLHTIAVILLFLVLRQMTGTLWRSAFVAAVFAIHPLHVESIAWISERKDVLSAVFFMLTLGAYTTIHPDALAYILPVRPALFRVRSDVKTDFGDGSVCFAITGRLAFQAICTRESTKIRPPEQSEEPREYPSNLSRKDSLTVSFVCLLRGNCPRSTPLY